MCRLILTAGICLIVTSLASITTASSGGVNSNYCTGVSDGYYANPGNTTCYYMCSCGGTFPECCLTGYVFQGSSSNCVPTPNPTPVPTTTTTKPSTTTQPTTTTTTTRCTTTIPTTTTKPTTTTTTTTTQPTTSITTTTPPGFCLGKSDGYYANPNSACCYYMCSCGGTFPECCLTGYVFQGSSSNCVPTLNPTSAPTTTTTQPTTTTTTTRCTTTIPTTTTKPTTTTTTTTTQPTTSITTTTPSGFCLGKSDGYYANPNSACCYYMCSCGGTFPECCLTGYVFQGSSSNCVPTLNPTSAPTTTTTQPTTTTTTTRCTTTTPTTTTKPTTTTTTTTTQPTTSITTTTPPGFCLGKSDGYYANPNSACCYYMCSCGGTFPECCLTGYVFQGSSSNCVPTLNPTSAPTTTTTQPTTTTTTTRCTTTIPTTTTKPTTTTTTTTTQPTTSITTTTPPGFCLGKSDGYYANPNSACCYYMCSCGGTFPECCLTGYVFQGSSSNCVPTPNPTPVPTTTTTTQPTTTTTTTTQPTTSITTTAPPGFCLGKSDGYYANPNSAGCYYMCSCGGTFNECCLTGYVFKASSSSCG